LFKNKISKVRKRDGKIVDFDRRKILNAVKKAATEIGENHNIAEKTTQDVEKKLFHKYIGRVPSVETIQDLVEESLIKLGYSKTAKTYITYRQQRKELREEKQFLGVKSDELKLSVNAIQVLERRYLLRNPEGEVIETPIQMFKRVAKAIAAIDKKYDHFAGTEEKYFEIMTNLEFIPNTPTLMNAGTKFQMLSACFVLPVEDSLDKIFDTLKYASLIQKMGGGTGFNFSKLRARGSIVGTTKGIASGPVSFMEIFDRATDVIKQGSKRRGANMGILRADHPDIIEFINSKLNENKFLNFNISVSVTEKFMKAVIKNEKYELIDPRTKKTVKKLNARQVFELIANNAWQTGDPGIIFIDKINEKHPLYEKIESTNPCGEQPLLDWESCNLGSINLAKFVSNGKIDWERLADVTRLATNFLDNVIDANDYVAKETETITKRNRKIGLGIMGWAEMLIQLKIPYDSQEALKLAEKIMEFIDYNSKIKSLDLAKQRGAAPSFRQSNYIKKGLNRKGKLDWKRLNKEIKKYGLRNITTTTIAPTGSISIIGSCSSGIEPLFAVSYIREVMEGTKLSETNKLFEEEARRRGFYNTQLLHDISKYGSIQKIGGIPKDVKNIFVTATDIDYSWHVKMQAAFQKYTDNGVSKTINLPEEATKEDVKRAYLFAYKLECKGITVFRYGSKNKQVLYLDDYSKRMKASSEFSGGCPTIECGN